jgi:hypothetical protein
VLIAFTPELMVTGNANMFLRNCQQIFMFSEATQKRDGLDFVCRQISAPVWGDFIVATFFALSSGCSKAARASRLRGVMPRNKSRLWLRRCHRRQLPHARMSASLEPLPFPYRRVLRPSAP